jgi:hypothetical protein
MARQDRMVEMVEKMLRLQLVYELYGLTEEEIRVVEGRLKHE